MPTKKELNPSPAEVSGEGKNETISATLGKDYGTLSPNPNFDDKNVDGEHATPVRVEKAAEVQPTEVHNSAQVLKLIKEYDEAHPVSSTKLYRHNLTFNVSNAVCRVEYITSKSERATDLASLLSLLDIGEFQGKQLPLTTYAYTSTRYIVTISVNNYGTPSVSVANYTDSSVSLTGSFAGDNVTEL